MCKWLVICCYFPCDSRTQDVSNDFRECCNAIEVFMSKQSYAVCVIGGDLNMGLTGPAGLLKVLPRVNLMAALVCLQIIL